MNVQDIFIGNTILDFRNKEKGVIVNITNAFLGKNIHIMWLFGSHVQVISILGLMQSVDDRKDLFLFPDLRDI